METLLGNPREEEGKLHTWRKKQVAGGQRLCFQCPFLGKLHFVSVCVGGWRVGKKVLGYKASWA